MNNPWWWCSLFSLQTEHLLGANLIQRIKIVSLSRNLLLTLTGICRIQGKFSLLLFLTRNTRFEQNWSKKYLMKFNEFKCIKNFIAIFTFLFWLEIPLSDKFVLKNQNCQFKLKFGSKSILIRGTRQWCSLYLC